jgi:sugar O-acyltransferase (sialic acid O-acetyltransferase NeuD family)
MRTIWILGAGGLAREIAWLAHATGLFEVRGFIDRHAGTALSVYGQRLPVVAETELPGLPLRDELALGTGDPALRSALGMRYRDQRGFPNIFHPSVCGDHSGSEFGTGNLFTANVVFTTSIRIGHFNLFNLATTIGHDCVIGDANVINPSANISGAVTIGDRVLVGTNATILQGRTIGHGATVGAASLVNKDVPEGMTVVGIPAKPLVR